MYQPQKTISEKKPDKNKVSHEIRRKQRKTGQKNKKKD